MPFDDQDKSKIDAALRDFMATDGGKKAFMEGAPKEGDTPAQLAEKTAKIEGQFRGWLKGVNEKGSTEKDGIKDNALNARVILSDDRKTEAAGNYLRYQINNSMLPEAQRQKNRELDDDTAKHKKNEAEESEKKGKKGFLEGAGDFIGDNKGSMIGALMGGLLGFMIGGPIGALIGLLFGLLIGGQGDKSGGIGGMLGITGKKGEPSGPGQGQSKGQDVPAPANTRKTVDGHQVFGINETGNVVYPDAPGVKMWVHGDVKVGKDGQSTFQVDRVAAVENGKVVGDKNFNVSIALSGTGNNLTIDESSQGFQILKSQGTAGIMKGAFSATQQPAGGVAYDNSGHRLPMASADRSQSQAPGAAGGGMIPPAMGQGQGV